MPLAEDVISARYSIQAYDRGQITINETIYRESLIITAERLIAPWPVRDIDGLLSGHIDDILDLQPDVVLLGTGEQQRFPDMSIIAAFAGHGLGLEVMNNGAACRTFNILVGEGRNVVAALIQQKASALSPDNSESG